MASGYMTFTLSSPTTVYVAYDSRVSVLPAWLSGFTDMGDTILTSLSSQPSLKIYRKDFPAGCVDLGANKASPASAVTASNYIVFYGDTGEGGCPVQTNEPIITREDTWKYDIENTGTNWMNTGYDDSGWSTGSGVFGEESKAAQYGYSITTPIAYTSMSMFFRKTFTVCDPMEVTGLTLNSLFDDGMVVYVNGTRVYSKLVSGDPPPYDGGITTCCHEAVNYESKDLTSVIGLSALRSLLTAGSNNVIAVGVYNDVPISSDIVWDGELVINHNASW
jgi:hypothetical protein